MSIKQISEICAGFLTPIIGALAVYIAWQQHRTNRNNLRLNLYDRRYEVFDALMSLLAHIAQRVDVTDEQLYEFYRATNQSQFLFGKEISEYLEEISKNARNLQYLAKILEDQSLSEKDRQKTVEVNFRTFLVNHEKL